MKMVEILETTKTVYQKKRSKKKMKYIIKRTSAGYNEKPHKDAVLKELDCFEIRSCSKEILRDELKKKDWQEYENFEKTATIQDETSTAIFCKRHQKRACWVIEIDDLNKFCDENGDIIIYQKTESYPYKVIEIYDDYRE